MSLFYLNVEHTKTFDPPQYDLKIFDYDLKKKLVTLVKKSVGFVEKLGQSVNVCILVDRQTEKIAHLQKENSSLHRQLVRMQKIVQKYNEGHNGAAFHLNAVDGAPGREHSRFDMDRKMTHKNSISTIEISDSNGTSQVRERTYLEGDQMVSYPTPNEENAIIKDRLKKNIYSARKGDSRSSNVAQCLRCHVLFKPSENNHKSCKFHHKGREIKEQFDSTGRLEKVVYKWACCKKPLETPGCCFGYHI